MGAASMKLLRFVPRVTTTYRAELGVDGILHLRLWNEHAFGGWSPAQLVLPSINLRSIFDQSRSYSDGVATEMATAGACAGRRAGSRWIASNPATT
jgi:hypothetical protein